MPMYFSRVLKFAMLTVDDPVQHVAVINSAYPINMQVANFKESMKCQISARL